MADPVIVLATDFGPEHPAWERTEAQLAGLRSFASRALGVSTRGGIAWLPAQPSDELGEHRLSRVIERAGADASLIFVLPTAFELNVWQRTMLGEELSEARRMKPAASIHHDTVDPTHPLLVDCFCDELLRALDERHAAPRRAGLLLVADGQGDQGTRADSYRLMRLLWEQAGMGRGEVAFIRHAQPFLADVLERCATDPLDWVLVPQCQWLTDLSSYAQVMLADYQRAHPAASAWQLLQPPQDHPAIAAWFEQRLVRLWEEKRAREAVRIRSAKHNETPPPTGVWSGEDWRPVEAADLRPRAGIVGRARDSRALGEVLARVLPPADRYLVKVTWHGYAEGTFTGAAALDLLLEALPGQAVVLEGHTSSRNVGGLDIDWETDAEQHRHWIRQQDVEFLRRTGLMDVISRHDAQYLNVTEAWWDGACAPAEEVERALGGVPLEHPDLMAFVPRALMALRGAPFISFARMKGPTRLGLSNLFGLIPHPLRSAWHGPDITYFASVCCDLAQIYGSLFQTFGLVEGFDSAVRWDRKGLYRSRWGNYDLILTDGLFTLSEGLTGADILASRMQGQDIRRSGYYDVVRRRLECPRQAEELPLPMDLQSQLA